MTSVFTGDTKGGGKRFKTVVSPTGLIVPRDWRPKGGNALREGDVGLMVVGDMSHVRGELTPDQQIAMRIAWESITHEVEHWLGIKDDSFLKVGAVVRFIREGEQHYGQVVRDDGRRIVVQRINQRTQLVRANLTPDTFIEEIEGREGFVDLLITMAEAGTLPVEAIFSRPEWFAEKGSGFAVARAAKDEEVICKIVKAGYVTSDEHLLELFRQHSGDRCRLAGAILTPAAHLLPQLARIEMEQYAEQRFDEDEREPDWGFLNYILGLGAGEEDPSLAKELILFSMGAPSNAECMEMFESAVCYVDDDMFLLSILGRTHSAEIAGAIAPQITDMEALCAFLQTPFANKGNREYQRLLIEYLDNEQLEILTSLEGERTKVMAIASHTLRERQDQ